jgi:hypothetical protein
MASDFSVALFCNSKLSILLTTSGVITFCA